MSNVNSFQLYDAGYTNLDALEPSSKMLELAKKRNIYKRHMCEYLGPKKLDIDDGMYTEIEVT